MRSRWEDVAAEIGSCVSPCFIYDGAKVVVLLLLLLLLWGEVNWQRAPVRGFDWLDGARAEGSRDG
jgi:hypothetical protein